MEARTPSEEVLPGRAEALAAVGAAVDAVAEGHRGVLLVEGDAGIGKTTLVRWVLARRPATAVLSLGLAACGDDDDATTDTTEAEAGGEAAGGGDVEEFCSALLEFNVLVNESDAGADDATEEEIVAAGEELVPAFERVVDNAPEAAAGPAEELEPVLDALLEGDATAFGSDETFATYTELTGQAAEHCEWRSQAVTAVDYAFEGVPASLEAGEYAMVCFVPVGSTADADPEAAAEDAPPHFTQGMLAEFSVE